MLLRTEQHESTDIRQMTPAIHGCECPWLCTPVFYNDQGYLRPTTAGAIKPEHQNPFAICRIVITVDSAMCKLGRF